LAKDAIGHQQIREISSRAWNRSYVVRKQRRVPTYYQDLIDIIGSNPGHVVGSTACLGGCLPTQLIRNRDMGAPSIELIKTWISQIQEIFGKDDFYFEMQPSFNKDQIYVNQKIIELGNELGIKFIITNDAHYLKKEDRPIHKAFLNAQQGDREVDDFYATTYLMSSEEIYHYMEKSLGDENIRRAYQTINEIVDKCEDYSLMKSLKIPRLNWKTIEVSDEQRNKYRKLIPYFNKFLDSKYKEDRHLANILIDRIDNDKPKLPSIRKRIKLINSNNLKIGKILEEINNKELMPEIIKQFYKDKKKKGYASFIPNKEFNTLFIKRYHKKYNKNEENNNSNNSNKEKI
jgi:DNA polymerase-3 subunit alpha